MIEKIIKSGVGWRVGWNHEDNPYQGLIGTDFWTVELTKLELHDFCYFLTELTKVLTEISTELMEEEKITIDMESERLWIQLHGYPHDYHVYFILQNERKFEGTLSSNIIPELLANLQQIIKSL